MNLTKYIVSNKYSNGEIISNIIKDLNNIMIFNNILFIRTPTTGAWLDKLLVNDNRVTRILYKTEKQPSTKFHHKRTVITDSDNLENILLSLGKTFDLICIDPFHEYIFSKRDFELVYKYLDFNGILLSHDCFPKSINYANSKYTKGNWSGETYIAFIEFAHNNPYLYYALLNIDTGIGIISKTNCIKDTIQIMNDELIVNILELHNNDSNLLYDFFRTNIHKIIKVL